MLRNNSKNKIIMGIGLSLMLVIMGACEEKQEVTSQGENSGKSYKIELLSDTPEITYQNGDEITGIGDPYAFTCNGMYYMTATSNGQLFDLYQSTDMKEWSYVRKIFQTSYTEGWVKSNLWQPQLIQGTDGKFYLYYCGNNRDNSLRIGVAVADTVEGPYKDVKNKPLFDLGYATIDPYLYLDEDGSMYLYYSRDCSENVVDGKNTSQIYVVEMESYTKLKEGSEHRLLLSPEQNWELRSGDWLWNEGPDLLKHQGKYYLFYSANCYASYDYSIGYAVSDSPLGPFVKYENNPVISAIGKMSGTGNNSFFYSLDGKELFTAYHTHTDPVNGGGNRKLTIDRCGFQEDGTFYISGPTMARQPEPSGTRTFIKDFAGVSVSSSAEGKDAKSLFDGTISKTLEDISCEWTTASEDKEQYIVVDFGSQKEIREIVLYPTFRDTSVPQNLQVQLDDGGIISAIALSTNDSMEPVILSFEPKATQHVKIILGNEEEPSELGLAEIMFLE
ncbi:MAG: xsa43F [Herbinix sp.]|jgi:GH43 family beta-xylosidase|nr:xsa43F [Herbinix sp.]